MNEAPERSLTEKIRINVVDNYKRILISCWHTGGGIISPIQGVPKICGLIERFMRDMWRVETRFWCENCMFIESCQNQIISDKKDTELNS